MRANDEPGVRIVRMTTAPASVASSGSVAQYGVVAMGEQWDEGDW